MIRRRHALVLALSAVAGCSGQGEVKPTATAATAPLTAVAMLTGKEGTKAGGTLIFQEKDGQVRIAGDLSGLTPGSHGIHIHEVGDCSAGDFASAGDHFNPTGEPHACPPTAARHAGDLGNVEVGADGAGRFEIVTDAVTISTGPRSIAGRAIIVHDSKDDCTTQPSGGSGARVACGVIEKR